MSEEIDSCLATTVDEVIPVLYTLFLILYSFYYFSSSRFEVHDKILWGKIDSCLATTVDEVIPVLYTLFFILYTISAVPAFQRGDKFLWKKRFRPRPNGFIRVESSPEFEVLATFILYTLCYSIRVPALQRDDRSYGEKEIPDRVRNLR